MEHKYLRASFKSNYVTDVEYYMDPAIRRKLIFLARRCTEKNFQNVLITEGKEGYGKSTCTAGQSYYMAYLMKRPLKLFFNVDYLAEEAKHNKDEVYIWDDAAISGLTLEAYNKEIIKFIKVLLLARKKRHTYFINIQEVFRLKEPIVSRASGMTRVYSPDEVTLGKFVHYLEKPLQKLYFDWQHGKKKNYNKYVNLRGTFSNCLYDIFDENEYESLKDESILSIGNQHKHEADEKKQFVESLKYENKMLKYALSILPEQLGITQKDLSKSIGYSHKTISNWKNYKDIAPRVEFSPVTEAKKETKRFIIPKTDYLGVHHAISVKQ